MGRSAITACVVLLRTASLVRGQGVETGAQCLNRLDDDGDALIDCLDPDCASNAICFFMARAGEGGGADGPDDSEACAEDPQNFLRVDPSVKLTICYQAVRLLRGANDRDCTANAREEVDALLTRPAVAAALAVAGQQIDTSAIPEGLDVAALCPCACATEAPTRPAAGGVDDTGGDAQPGGDGSAYCAYTNDAECDENLVCPAGTDTADCCLNGQPRPVDPAGRTVTAANVCCGDCAPPGPDSCAWANDGECDEPTGICPGGTDTTDCAAFETATCAYAGDNACDEPLYCSRGSDTEDCCLDGQPRQTDPAGNPVVASDVSCSAGDRADGSGGSRGGGGRGGGSRGGGSRGGQAGGRGGGSDTLALCDDGSRPVCASIGGRPGTFGCPDGSTPACADGTDMSQQTGPVCNTGALMVNCAGANPDSFDEDIDIDDLCEDPCIRSLIPCSSNPVLIGMMGAEEAAGIAALGPLCAPAPSGATGPGDGICDARALFELCDDDQGDEACDEEDIDCFCASGCGLETMDCAESPVLAGDRETVLMLQGICREPEGMESAPGDGVCSLRQASALCDESELEDMDDFEELEEREERNLLPYYNCEAPPQLCLDTFGTRHELFDPSVCCQCLEDTDDAEICPPLCLQVDEQCHGVLACEGVCTELEAGDLAELIEYREELCAEPCVMELIDCSSSRLLPRSERAELVALRTACGTDRRDVLTTTSPVQLELTMTVDMASIAPDTAERYAFERRFKSDVARAANVAQTRVVIDGVRQGSVVVTFHISEPQPGNSRASSADDAIAQLETALSTGTVTVVGEVVPATALVVVETLPPPAPPPRLSSTSSESGADQPDDQIGESNDTASLLLATVAGAMAMLVVVVVVALCRKKRMKLGPVDGERIDAVAAARGYVEHQEAGPVGVQHNVLAVGRSDSQMTFRP